MVINTNIGANRTSRLLADSTSKLNGALARLASGSKIVEPQDDAAGLAVSTKFDAQINRNKSVQNNLSSALSFSQTQDGFLQKVASLGTTKGERNCKYHLCRCLTVTPNRCYFQQSMEMLDVNIHLL